MRRRSTTAPATNTDEDSMKEKNPLSFLSLRLSSQTRPPAERAAAAPSRKNDAPLHRNAMRRLLGSPERLWMLDIGCGNGGWDGALRSRRLGAEGGGGLEEPTLTRALYAKSRVLIINIRIATINRDPN